MRPGQVPCWVAAWGLALWEAGWVALHPVTQLQAFLCLAQ